MKTSARYFLITFFILIFLLPTDSFSQRRKRGGLNRAGAERAIKRWAKNFDSITVQGIQEEGNNARADINFKNVRYNYYNRERVWSGLGYAVFIRYNDGRWFMKQVVLGQNLLNSAYTNTNIEVQ